MLLYTEGDDGLTPFERKYMFTEATDKRKNVRRITIDMEDGKRNLKVNGNDANLDDTASEEDDINSDDEDLDTDEEPTDSLDDEESSIATEPDDTEGETNDSIEPEVDADNNGDVEGDDGNDIASEPDDTTNTTTDNNADSENSNDENDNTEESPEEKEEVIHKQALFGKFQTLYEIIGNYCAKLDDLVGETDESNHKIKEINNQLKQLSDFLYDYMIIKFKDASYMESMLFYQRSIAVVNLSLDMLEEVKKLESNKKS